MMIEKHFEDLVSRNFGFTFSPSQQEAVSLFARFLFARNADGLFLLKGYAGTGKTSLVAAFVSTLAALQYQVALLAPTGRAAKVFTGYAGHPAFTIHKKIYRQKTAAEGEGIFNLGFNPCAGTLFFVDEASMISNTDSGSPFGNGRLLDDLMEYVYNGRHNRLILIGDIAQLPPVGLDLSPALDRRELEAAYHLNITEVHLTDIMRQAEASGILYNATRIRQRIGSGSLHPTLKALDFPDVCRISGAELLEEIDSCYSKYGEEETMIVCRSNKRANRFNEGIRRSILYREEELCNGDRIMVVKNNYYWGNAHEKTDFIANGDIGTVRRISKRQEMYGFHFIQATLQLDGYAEEITARILTDTLMSDHPALSYEQSKALYLAVENDYADTASKRKRLENIRGNEFYNALQIKFAYAVTCHKAQGGQWDAVFIDQGYLPEDKLDNEYWRWLYTAVTRARKRVYFLNFRADFFQTKA